MPMANKEDALSEQAWRCTKCHQKRSCSAFPKNEGKGRARICGDCRVPRRDAKPCRTCGEVQPMASFGSVLKPNGGIRRREDCTKCFRPAMRSKVCEQCHERLSVEKFPGRAYYQRNGSTGVRRERVCEDCASRKQPAERACLGCGQQKPLDAFRKRLGGGRTQRCKECPVHAEKGPPGPILRALPEPCLHCNETMWTTKAPSRTREVKYCSQACSNLGRRAETRHCDQCLEMLPAAEFDRPPRSRARMVWRCRQCVQDIKQGWLIARPGSGTPAYLLKVLSARAKREGVPVTVSYRQLRAKLQQPCMFCGGEPDTITPYRPGAPFEDGNLRPLCAPCRKFCSRTPLEDVEAFIRRAAPQAASSGAPASLAAKRRKLRPEPPPPPGLRRSDMVPLEVHGAPVAGESWDERLARYLRPKGPLGGKQKPEEETNA